MPYRCIVGFYCFYENIQTDENTSLVINFDETNYSLDCIGFVNSTLSELPSNLFNKYQAINSLYASYMRLTSLPKHTLQNATKLEEVHLAGNLIKSLAANVFTPCKSLRRVSLANNLLADIDEDTFEGNQQLEDVDLANNQLLNIPHKTFGQLNSLRSLNLRNNSLQVRYGMFPASLISLDLSYNKLENFTLKSVINLVNLKQLYLNGNLIYRFRQFMFPDGILTPLKQLKYIQLSDNDFYCTTLADIVIWLDKHRLEIQVEPHFLVINNSNIRGVACKEEQRYFV